MSVDFETRDLFPKAPAPQAFLGAASPLWGFFAGAALSGMTFWWMTRLAQPANLEALFARTAAAPEQAAAAAEAMAEPVTLAEALIEPVLPDVPLGGEAAPMSPALATSLTEDLAPQAFEPVAVETTPEPMAAPPEATPATEPRSVKPKVKAAPPAEPPPL